MCGRGKFVESAWKVRGGEGLGMRGKFGVGGMGLWARLESSMGWALKVRE